MVEYFHAFCDVSQAPKFSASGPRQNFPTPVIGQKNFLRKNAWRPLNRPLNPAASGTRKFAS